VSTLPWIYAANGLGQVERDMSNGASAPADGGALTIRGASFAKGIGVAGPSAVVYRLKRGCTTFSATIGIDDQAKGLGSVVFQVWGDGHQLFDSGILTGTSPAMPIQVDVTSLSRIKLMVTNGGNGADWDYADWADAQITCS
jgi:hypothetical protein